MTRYPSFATFEELESFFGEEAAQVAEPVQSESPKAYVYSVSEIVDALNTIFRHRIGVVFVRGEISGLSRSSPRGGNGHRYFRIKEGTRAVLDAALFAPAAARLPFALEEGMEVQCQGRLAVYGQQGRLQLVVDRMERVGVGALMIAFQRLKELLDAEGLFDPYRKKPIPTYPRCIGLVTSPVGAALRDLLQVFRRRSPSVSLLLAPCQVQGRGAAAEIVRAIQALNEQTGIDLIILGRGGGSIEDLWAFNEEAVARAIAASRLPILTGIGHETDYTIADFVADKRAPTPSAAAEMAAPADQALLDAIEERRYRMLQAISAQIGRARLRLERLARRLPSPEQQVHRLHLRLADAQQRTERALLAQIAHYKRRLAALRTRLEAQDPGLALQQQQQTLRLFEQRLHHAMQRSLDQQRHRLGLFAQRLHDLSPLQILDRGYALVSDMQGHLLRHARDLQEGQQITIRLQQGQAVAQIVSILPEPPPSSLSTSSDTSPSAESTTNAAVVPRKRSARPNSSSQLPLPIFSPKNKGP